MGLTCVRLIQHAGDQIIYMRSEYTAVLGVTRSDHTTEAPHGLPKWGAMPKLHQFLGLG